MISDYDFFLPPELVAQHPAPERSASRLLDGRQWPSVDRVFRDLAELLDPKDLLVFNDTRVIKARLFGRKATGGAVEVLVERVLPACEVWAHIRASKAPRVGTLLTLAEAFEAEVLGRGGPEDSLFRLKFPAEPLDLLQAHGHVPLPPYITHADAQDDERRYQTVFAQRPGAVAAPTASLHFDEPLLDALDARGLRQARITLHVGAGTFAPMRVERLERLEDHRMHSEWFEVGLQTVQAVRETQAAGGRVVAVGTTTVRTLESAARLSSVPGTLQPASGETSLFITPGFQFQVVDTLITNFHLPKSTLMVLVSTFAGHEHVRALYAHAIAQRYRFFSYGDAMILNRRQSSPC